MDESGRLFGALCDGNVDLVTSLIDSMRQRGEDSDAYYLLCEVLNSERADYAKLLILGGANVNNDPGSTDWTPLHVAVRNDDVEIVEMLLDRDANINAENQSGETPLHVAVDHNCPEIINLLVTRNGNVNAKSKVRTTPLHIAAECASYQIVEYLLNHGACINALCDSKWGRATTPLDYACAGGRKEVVELLLDKDAEINKHFEGNIFSSLHIAIESRQHKIINLLLKHGADIDAQNTVGNTALCLAVNIGDMDIIESILKYRPNVNNEGNMRSLSIAIRKHHVIKKKTRKIVKKLLKYGFTVNAEIDVDSLLRIALKNQCLDVAEVLIKSGVDFIYKNCDETSIVIDVLVNDDVKSLRLLFDHGIGSKDYSRLLRDAARIGSVKSVKFLFQKDLHIDINAADMFGMTALHYTAIGAKLSKNSDQRRCAKTSSDHDRGDIAKKLLQSGANVNAQCKLGYTTLHIAVMELNVQVVNSLLEFNADVNMRNNESMTPLHCLASQKSKTSSNRKGLIEKDSQILDMLLYNGADANAKKRFGTSVLQLAVKVNRIDFVEALLTYGVEYHSEVIQEDELPFSDSVHWYHRLNETVSTALVDIHAKDEYGTTALLLAASIQKRDKIFQVLLNHETDINFTLIDEKKLRTSLKKIFHMHIWKLKALGHHLSERISRLISNISDEHHYNKCKDEIERMKREKIGTYKVSMYDILTKNVNRLAVYAKNESLMQNLASSEYKEKFRIYSGMIDGNLVNGQKRNILLTQSAKSFDYLFGYGLPDFMSIEILEYLSNRDLVNMIKACSNIVTRKCDS